MQVFELPCKRNGYLVFAAGDYTEANCYSDCDLQDYNRTCGCVALKELRENVTARYCLPSEVIFLF